MKIYCAFRRLFANAAAFLSFVTDYTCRILPLRIAKNLDYLQPLFNHRPLADVRYIWPFSAINNYLSLIYLLATYFTLLIQLLFDCSFQKHSNSKWLFMCLGRKMFWNPLIKMQLVQRKGFTRKTVLFSTWRRALV